MPYIHLTEAQAWAESSKLAIAAVDTDLEDSVAAEVFARLASAYDTSAWDSPSTTPSLVRKVIAMRYVSWQISRAYAADAGENEYALRLLGMSDMIITGLVDGTTVLLDDPNQTTFDTTPSFYPNDASSALEPTTDDRSLGGPAFTMGVIW